MITTQKLVDLLNEAFALDPEAIAAVCLRRVPCSAALADHGAIVCGEREDAPGGPEVGVVGLLNGVLAPSRRLLGMKFDAENHLIGFCVIRLTGNRASSE